MELRRWMIAAGVSLLILLPAGSAVRAHSAFFYVIPTSAPLRECASPGCAVLLTVYQGDKVEILERTAAGWSKVRLVDKPAGIGWIPNDWLSFSPDRKSVTLPTYYVNRDNLPLREHPRPEALVLTLDGVGDGLCGSLWILRDGALTPFCILPARTSLGIFFEHVTNLMNMRELEDERYKKEVLAEADLLLARAEEQCAEILAIIAGR